jgi:transaldolase
MKIFLDTAEADVVRKHWKTGLIDGLTTNPSLIRKSGRKHEEVYEELKDIGIPDISMEVIGSKENMISEGKRLYKKFGKVATIKVPCTYEGLQACANLSVEGIKVNVTLIFSQAQAILSAKAGAKYVSPFVGRVDDNSFGGLCLVRDIANVYKEHMVTKTEILAASLRGVRDVGRAFEYGADIVTMPTGVFEGMYKHILTDKGLDQFDKDYAASIKE